MQSEKNLQKQVETYLKSMRPYVWFMKTHGGTFQKAGIPDIIGCNQGRFFGIELKRKGEKPTPLQDHTIHTILDSQGYVCVADDLYSVKQFMGVIV